jgi:hypothetical protein
MKKYQGSTFIVLGLIGRGSSMMLRVNCLQLRGQAIAFRV